VALCTGRVFRQEADRVVVADAAACWLCGHCVAVCPADPVLHSDYPPEACPPLDPACLPPADMLVAALRARRSVRVFRDRPVPREVVRELFVTLCLRVLVVKP
jgi:Fe-S-cluster-containing hydrogenase component 2